MANDKLVTRDTALAVRKAFEQKIKNGGVIPYADSDNISFQFNTNANYTLSATNNYASYIRVVGQVLFMVISFNIDKDSGASNDPITIGNFNNIPDDIFDKLVAETFLDEQSTKAYVDGSFTSVDATTVLVKGNDNDVSLQLDPTNLVANTIYHIRHMSVFLLTNNFFQPSGVRIENLGVSNPNNVTFSKSANFPTEAQAWEEVVINGNYFAKFTPWYKKPIYNGNELTGFLLSNVKEDDDYHIYDCFLDENGNVLPYILIGQYYCTSTSQASSVSGTASTMTIGAGRSLCQALGTGYQQMDASMFIFWRDLALAISQRVDFNSGQGVDSYLGLKGMAQGGWWIDGLTHINSTYLYCSKPSKYVDSPTASSDGYNALSYAMPTSSDYITKLGYDADYPTINFPSAVGGSTSTYYCDYLYYESGNRPCIVAVGSTNASVGLFYLVGYRGWSSASRVRLCFKPSIQ